MFYFNISAKSLQFPVLLSSFYDWFVCLNGHFGAISRLMLAFSFILPFLAIVIKSHSEPNPKNPYQKKLRWSKKGEGGLSFFTKSKKKTVFFFYPSPNSHQLIFRGPVCRNINFPGPNLPRPKCAGAQFTTKNRSGPNLPTTPRY